MAYLTDFRQPLISGEARASPVSPDPTPLTTNALRNVNQLGIEMHTCCNVISISNSMKTFKNIIKFMQQILNFYNLKLVAYNPNRCHGKLQDSQMIYYSYHDALFAK